MTFVPNPNLGRDLAAQVKRLQAAVSAVSTEYSGRPLNEVKSALQQRIAAVGNGASISGNELTASAQAISSGKRVRLTDAGKIVGAG